MHMKIIYGVWVPPPEFDLLGVECGGGIKILSFPVILMCSQVWEPLLLILALKNHPASKSHGACTHLRCIFPGFTSQSFWLTRSGQGSGNPLRNEGPRRPWLLWTIKFENQSQILAGTKITWKAFKNTDRSLESFSLSSQARLMLLARRLHPWKAIESDFVPPPPIWCLWRW